eukprot:1138765-Pelagomonas_calceolata.AAC.4
MLDSSKWPLFAWQGVGQPWGGPRSCTSLKDWAFLYQAASEVTRAVFRRYDPHFEAGSLDEAFLDVTHFCRRTGMSGAQVRREDNILCTVNCNATTTPCLEFYFLLHGVQLPVPLPPCCTVHRFQASRLLLFIARKSHCFRVFLLLDFTASILNCFQDVLRPHCTRTFVSWAVGTPTHGHIADSSWNCGGYPPPPLLVLVLEAAP